MAASHYVGKAGQCAVMAELALRGYNVAIPEVDVGDDIFVLNDATGRLFRIQVKTATGKRLVKPVKDRRPYRCQFSLRRAHLKNSSKSGSYYVLAARCGGAWRFLIFKTYILYRRISAGFGTRMPGGRHMVTVIFFERRKAKSSTLSNAIDLSQYAGSWDTGPLLEGGLNSI